MKAVNMPSSASRIVESGLVWIERITGGAGTFEARKRQSVRVSAVTLSSVSLDGMLSVTLQAGESLILNVGTGSPHDEKETVTVEVTGSAYVQIAKERETDK